jgi:hypothetical protein
MLLAVLFISSSSTTNSTQAVNPGCNTTNISCEDADACYTANRCDKFCDKLCCTGDCEVNTKYYCEDFNINLGELNGGCTDGDSQTCPVSSDSCEVYWRNANYKSCDKCCPDVYRWNGTKWEVQREFLSGNFTTFNTPCVHVCVQSVIDRDAICYELVQQMANQQCPHAQFQDHWTTEWKRITKACGGASTLELAKASALVLFGAIAWLVY